MSRATRWCFTLNNYTSDEHESIIALETKYKVIGKEVGKEGTPHLQGYLEFGKAMRFNAMNKLLPRAHLEPAIKPQQAAEYCKKEKDFIEEGTPSWKRMGYRSDLHGAHRIVQDKHMCALASEPEYKGEDVAVIRDSPFPWQSEVLSMLQGPPHRRNIVWYYNERGNVGMSCLAKYLSFCGLAVDVDIISGPAMITSSLIRLGPRQAYIFDMPFGVRRRDTIQRLMRVMEAIKDGMLDDGKNELLFYPPHVVVLAHCPPPMQGQSVDKWDIREIPTPCESQYRSRCVGPDRIRAL